MERPGFIDYSAAVMSLVGAVGLGIGTYYANNAVSSDVAAVHMAEDHGPATEAAADRGTLDRDTFQRDLEGGAAALMIVVSGLSAYTTRRSRNERW